MEAALVWLTELPWGTSAIGLLTSKSSQRYPETQATGVSLECSHSSFLVSEYSCILSRSGQNSIAYFWQHVKELVVKPSASDWPAHLFENLYSIQSLFCAKYELTAEDYIALTATALQLSCSRGNFKSLQVSQVFHSSVYKYLKSSPLPP